MIIDNRTSSKFKEWIQRTSKYSPLMVRISSFDKYDNLVKMIKDCPTKIIETQLEQEIPNAYQVIIDSDKIKYDMSSMKIYIEEKQPFLIPKDLFDNSFFTLEFGGVTISQGALLEE